MTQPDLPSLDERRALGRCLFTLLFLVSGADGRATAGELASIEAQLRGLDEQLGTGHTQGLDLGEARMAQARVAAEGLGFHLKGDEIDLARAALGRMEPARRAAYERYLVRACLAVAEASADFLGLGARINGDERQQLVDIFRHLGLASLTAEERDRLGL